MFLAAYFDDRKTVEPLVKASPERERRVFAGALYMTAAEVAP